MKTNYSYQNWKPESMARAYGRDLPISMKQSSMICKFIRGRSIEKAKQLLRGVLSYKIAVPFSQFNRDMGHKPGIGPGRYPQNATKDVLMVLESAEANAQNKGLDVGNLVVLHANAQLASRPWRYGRQTRRKAKRAHVEIVVGVQAKQEKKSEAKKKIETKVTKKPSRVAAREGMGTEQSGVTR